VGSRITVGAFALAKSGKRRTKRNIAKGIAHIKATFNNTLITITDVNGDAICWGHRRFGAARWW
jgi:ribosomal protein S11